MTTSPTFHCSDLHRLASNPFFYWARSRSIERFAYFFNSCSPRRSRVVWIPAASPASATALGISNKNPRPDHLNEGNLVSDVTLSYTRNSLSKLWYTQSQNGLILLNHLWSRNFCFPQGKVALIIITQFHDIYTKHAKYYPFIPILDSSENYTPFKSYFSKYCFPSGCLSLDFNIFRITSMSWSYICTTLIRSDDVISTDKYSTGFSSSMRYSNPRTIHNSEIVILEVNPPTCYLRLNIFFCWRSHELRCNLSQH